MFPVGEKIQGNYFQNYHQFWSETGRTGILCRKDLHPTQRIFQTETTQDKFQALGYESCWVEISCPGERKSILFCSFYRNLQKSKINYHPEEEQDVEPIPAILCFNLDMFEKELIEARKITEYIIIGGDWNSHNPVWLDETIDETSEIIVDFINGNNLQVLNHASYCYTFEKDGARSSIDITLCSESIASWCSNWRTDNDELDVDSDHLPITFNIRANWSCPNIKKQKIETWNLRNGQWEQYRQIL